MLRIVLAPLTVPLFLFIAVFVFLPLGLYGGLQVRLEEIRFRRRARRAGRVVNLGEVTNRSLSNVGTLIIESPTVGWGVTRAWWTADDVLAKAQGPAPTNDNYHIGISKEELPLKFDQWCWEEYISLGKGKAFLISTRIGNAREAKLRRMFPSVPLVHTWSAFVRKCEGPNA